MVPVGRGLHSPSTVGWNARIPVAPLPGHPRIRGMSLDSPPHLGRWLEPVPRHSLPSVGATGQEEKEKGGEGKEKEKDRKEKKKGKEIKDRKEEKERRKG